MFSQVKDSFSVSDSPSKLVPNYVWLATGGRGFLKKLAPRLKNCPFDVTLYPDHEAYDEWKAIGDKFGYVTSEACEIWAEQGLIPSGGDVRDFYRINTKREKKIQSGMTL